MNITGFHHIAFRTPDWDESIKFWRDGMGFPTKLEWGEAPRRATMLDLGDGNYFELFEREPSNNENTEERESSAMHWCLRVENCDEAVERAVAAGAVVTIAPADVDFNGKLAHSKPRIAFVKAPGGIIIEFFQSDVL